MNIKAIKEEEFQTMMDILLDIKRRLSETADSGGSEIMDVAEICQFLNVSKRTVHNLKSSGKLPYRKLGGRVYFYRSEVLEAMDSINLKS